MSEVCDCLMKYLSTLMERVQHDLLVWRIKIVAVLMMGLQILISVGFAKSVWQISNIILCFVAKIQGLKNPATLQFVLFGMSASLHGYDQHLEVDGSNRNLVTNVV